MLFLTCLITVLLSQSTHTFKNIQTVEHFKDNNGLRLINILKELHIRQEKHNIRRINLLNIGNVKVFKIMKSYDEEKPIRRRYTHITFNDINGIKFGLRPNGTVYYNDREKTVKLKTTKKPKKMGCRSKIERSRDIYFNNIRNHIEHTNTDTRRLDTKNEDIKNDTTAEATPSEEVEVNQNYDEDDHLKVSLPNSSIEINSNNNINYWESDSFSNVVPNDIFMPNEKKCANWLEDCNTMGVKDKLFKVLWSRYNS